MSVTIGEILQAGIIPDLQMLTAPPFLSDIAIEVTSTQGIYEMPIRSFIREHELVFSSAVGNSDEEDRYIDFISEVSDGNGSAIVMAFQNADYRLPDRVIKHAAALQIPLFAIPWEHRFF